MIKLQSAKNKEAFYREEIFRMLLAERSVKHIHFYAEKPYKHLAREKGYLSWNQIVELQTN